MSMTVAKLGKCVNANCPAEFKRLGSGEIYLLPIDEPHRWGLSANIRQKVVWLCAKCARTKHVRFDQVQCEVLVVNKHERQAKAA